jgi:hypothetical protein
VRDAIRKKGASRVAPLALVEHVVKLDFQALPFLIGCGRESLQRKADFSTKCFWTSAAGDDYGHSQKETSAIQE